MSYELVAYDTGYNEVAGRPKGSKNATGLKAPHETNLWKKFVCKVADFNKYNRYDQIILKEGDWFFNRFQ